MSLIISIFVNEGIVMASDSRVSFSSPLLNGPLKIQTGHHFDSEEKTFTCANGVGISTCGDASINKKSLAGIVKSFINQNIQHNTTVIETASKLLSYFKNLSQNLNSTFHVCGFDIVEGIPTRQLYRISTQGKGTIIPINSMTSGAFWDGDTHIISKVIKAQYITPIQKISQKVQIIDNGKISEIDNAIVLDSKQVQFSPEISIPWDYMSLQDAIDFARFAINTTVEAVRFENVNKTVGGPIDILVIQPDKTRWISHKKLH